MSNTFSHAGVSRLNGSFKVRFCNDAMRVKHLAKVGHKDIDIVELKVPMNKQDALAYLMKIDFANGNVEVQAALEDAVDRRSPKVAKAKVVKAIVKGASKEQKPNKEAKKPKKAAPPKSKVVTPDPAVTVPAVAVEDALI